MKLFKMMMICLMAIAFCMCGAINSFATEDKSGTTVTHPDWMGVLGEF